jgi:hypothetical protein
LARVDLKQMGAILFFPQSAQQAAVVVVVV